MRYLIKILLVVALITSFFSCEEVPVVIPDYVEIETGKTLLIEELTGVSCSNCPSGAAIINSIKRKYPDNIIVVGIHGDLLSEPVEKEGYESKYDFRIPEAKELEVFFSPDAKPAASFNRIPPEGFTGLSTTDKEQWFSIAEKELQKEQVIGLKMTTAYDPASRKVDIGLIVDPLKDLDGDFYVNLMVLESHIKDSQKDVGEIYKDYEHNHVLRDMITSVRGDALTTSMTENDEKTYTYSYTLPEEDGLWNPEHISIVGFISDQKGNSEEVLQSVEKYIVE